MVVVAAVVLVCVKTMLLMEVTTDVTNSVTVLVGAVDVT